MTCVKQEVEPLRGSDGGPVREHLHSRLDADLRRQLRREVPDVGGSPIMRRMMFEVGLHVLELRPEFARDCVEFG